MGVTGQDVERAFYVNRFSGRVDLGHCIIGENLSELALRGFAPMDRLAVISEADVYDQVTNPEGTQRDLKPRHASDCLKYAMSTLDPTPLEYPHAFPEVLLNARDTGVLRLHSLEGDEIDLNSTELSDLETRVVRVSVDLSALKLPKCGRDPQISRVDGNHRLAGVDGMMAKAVDGDEDLPEEFPVIPFAMFLGIKRMREGFLFKDVNGTPARMNTSHLEQLYQRWLNDRTKEELESALKRDKDALASWITSRLTEEGRIFATMVYKGGAKAGLKAEHGKSGRPLTLKSIKSAVKIQISQANTPVQRLADAGEFDLIADFVESFWRAVSEVYHDAWQDNRNFIVLQTIGFNALAQLGGEMAEKDKALKKADYLDKLRVIHDKESLAKTQFTGLAGAAGTSVVFDRLNAAATEDDVDWKKALDGLKAQEDSDEAIDRLIP